MLFKGNFVLVSNHLSLTNYHSWIKKWSWSTFWEQDERSHRAFPIHKNLFFYLSTFPILTRTTLFGCVSHARLVLKLRSSFVQKQPPDAFYINIVFLKTLQNLQGRTCARASFFYWKIVFGESAFLVILRNFSEYNFYRTHRMTSSVC